MTNNNVFNYWSKYLCVSDICYPHKLLNCSLHMAYLILINCKINKVHSLQNIIILNSNRLWDYNIHTAAINNIHNFNI